MKYSDKQILDWLDYNYFNQDRDSFDKEYLNEDLTIWRFYAPKERSGSVRWVIEGAMQRQGMKPDEK